jgi:hypothetical protein
MKETIKTALSRVDDLTQLFFRSKDNDGQREIYCNEYWKHQTNVLKMELLDVVDKKQVMLYGRSFMKLNIRNGAPFLEVLDPHDVLVDRYANPWDLDSASHVIHTGVFRRIEELERNPFYDKIAVARLKTFFGTQQGIIKAEENTQAAIDKNQRMDEMGVSDMDNPILGHTYVELNDRRQGYVSNQHARPCHYRARDGG